VEAPPIREANGAVRDVNQGKDAETMLFTRVDAMTMEVGMYDTYSLYGTAQAIAAERIAHAEQERAVLRAHLRNRAETRLQRAVALGRRDGLDYGTVARELATLLSDGRKN
jgi:hypothetical protein